MRGPLKVLVGVIMVVCFLYQMWDLFNQYLSELKTVAVSFEENKAIELPSFAFCDSTAFRKRIGVTANTTLYNATAFKVEDVSIMNELLPWAYNMTDTFTVHSFPTTDNGYCTLYEFHGEHPINEVVGKLKITAY